MTAFVELAEIFFPNRCLLCGARAHGALCSGCTPASPPAMERCPVCFEPRALPSGADRCELCLHYPTSARSLRYLWDYEGIYRELIHTIKYKPSKRLATALAKLIAPDIPKLFNYPSWELIVPIPSSKPALLRRGFNQCVILAAAVSVASEVPWSIFGLSHNGYRMRQAELRPERRLSNVKNALRASPQVVQGKAVLLIDDVLTTGATTGVACKELLDAGATTVDIFTIARSTNWHSARAEIYKKLYSLGDENTGTALRRIS
ncbi:MAG: ComF family protein [Proteobacteria bacterium]|nr:ComF family protein [Pseudomonadota bacterium]